MLKASSEVVKKAKEEFLKQGYSTSLLADELGLAVQLIENFFNAEIVDRHTYNLVCEKLNINLETIPEKDKPLIPANVQKSNPEVARSPQEIPNKPSVVSPQDISPKKSNSFDSIDQSQSFAITFQSLRQNISQGLTRQCDRLRLSNFPKPFSLQDLYTEVNLFTSLPSYQYLDLHEAFANVPAEQYDRSYLVKLQPSTTGANQSLEEQQYILITGGLGSGKTTLLKHWAISCINDKVLREYLPIFLPLRSLITLTKKESVGNSSSNVSSNYLGNPLLWIQAQIVNYGIPEKLLAQVLETQFLENLLTEGKLLLLWDGVDDLDVDARDEVMHQISSFSDRYPQNKYVIATRNPIYVHLLESFTALEIAPYQETQIATFASKWFQVTCPDQPQKPEKFQQLLTANQPLAEVASNPLFLMQICKAFNTYEYIKPQFYQEILSLLLSAWQQTKCLPPQSQDLSIAQKLDLMSYVAIVALEKHGYTWQNNQLEDDFQSCLGASQKLSHQSINLESLLAELKWKHSLLIECATGIYRIPSVTLHDYLAAYRLANIKAAIAEKYLLERIYQKRWHGVIVMTISISQQADQILLVMKRKIDALVSKDPQLQSYLSWVNQQSIQMQTPYKAVTIRALYLDIDLENTRSLDRARALDIAHSRSLERARMRSMGIDNTMETEVDIDYTINLALNLDLALYFANNPILELACTLEPELNRGLRLLRQKFPNPYKDREKFAKWWQAKGLDWSKKLRSLIVQHRKGSQEWKFSDNQLKILRTYHDASKLLVECLNSAEYVSPLVKDQIESTLLLPQSEYKILQM
ncbi:MAG: hypothetical protein AUK48_01315 [Oscillatoriales cyanobacterium CG2_30_44_21]|nr:MAG: hypothetical protein AUK48_01315 [Oscillatoriales cyanobacterium CG2_30_44_21]